MLDLVKVDEQPGNCREIYQDKNTKRLYCRIVNDFYSKGRRVNHWCTFNIEPDCPLKDGTEIKISDKFYLVERDEWSDWAIEKETTIEESKDIASAIDYCKGRVKAYEDALIPLPFQDRNEIQYGKLKKKIQHYKTMLLALEYLKANIKEEEE